MCARDQSSIFSTGRKFHSDNGLLLELHAVTLVARSHALLFDYMMVVVAQSMCTHFHQYSNTKLKDFVVIYIPYTRVNKRMRLFAKLQGNMHLIPNMRLIVKGKIDHTSKTVMPSLVARVLDSKCSVTVDR